LEQFFTASMIAHSNSILSELKMTTIGPHAAAKKSSPSVSTALPLKAMPNV